MGFHSSDCSGCGHSVRHRGATLEVSGWMSQCVVLRSNGDRISGEYDGYGRVGSYDADNGAFEGADVWHKACHRLAGSPEFKKVSRSSHDQGHFVGEYDPPAPQTMADMVEMKKTAEAAREKNRLAWKQAVENYQKEAKLKEEAAAATTE